MKQRTDYEIELEEIDNHLLGLEQSAITAPVDNEEGRRFISFLYRRASLTGNFDELAVAETAINNALEQIGPWPDLCLVKANLDFKLHRLARVWQDLAMLPGLIDSPQGKALKADLDLQEGRYQEARTGYEEVIQQDRSWDNLARLAYLQARLGDSDTADQLYSEAEDEITVKQMRSYAWVEVQRGLQKFLRGRYEDAWMHYKRASEAYSGYWLIDEHIAELLAAQGRFDEAIMLYESIIARIPRPEILQALGDLYLFMGKPPLALPWHEKSLAAYLESVRQGDVHYYHHLADFYADVRKDGTEAVKWARKDLALRQNDATQAALAWGLYRCGQLSEALEVIDQALSSGMKNARLLSSAATLYQAVGWVSKGRQLLQKAIEINPYYQDFHVHH